MLRRITYGPLSFAVSGPFVCNDLPPNLRASPGTLRQFQSTLKTILFCSNCGNDLALSWLFWPNRSLQKCDINLLTYLFNIITLGLISHRALFCSMTSLPSARQHPSYGDCLEVMREYYQHCSVLGCVNTQCSQSAAHSCEQFLQVQQIGFVILGPLRHT